MSGHSKWSTIKRQKGAADIKRGQAFTKMANSITIAVKTGGSSDPASNPRLRMAVDEARSVNMPKANIQRAIERGLGRVDGQSVEEVVYEGFGPGKVAFVVEAVTDNKLRTLQAIKNIFERSGGSMSGQGSVAYMFESKGGIRVKGEEGSSEEEETLELIDTGAEDIESFEQDGVRKYLVYTDGNKLAEVSNKIAQAGYEVESQELVLKPITLVQITDQESAKRVLEFTDKLEELDDVQKVYANFDIPEELIN